ncbi:MAG TPA: hypothetical protein VJG90_08095 [Candidatus Nanoarchaeia archaeon]|nr:hypothetical protein [Candidatus Nanoarchaeia archaeon]
MATYTIRKHIIKQWEVSIAEYKNERISYKVTRRIPYLFIAETKIFYSKQEAKAQFQDWLR